MISRLYIVESINPLCIHPLYLFGVMAELSTSDIDLDDESHEANEPPKKKICYKQKYNSSWEKDPIGLCWF